MMMFVTMGIAMVATVLVPMVPKLGLVQQKKEHQPSQQRRKQRLRSDPAFKSLGQQVHEGRGQQRARCQAEHVLGVTRQNAKAQHRCQPHTAYACGQSTDQNCY